MWKVLPLLFAVGCAREWAPTLSLTVVDEAGLLIERPTGVYSVDGGYGFPCRLALGLVEREYDRNDLLRGGEHVDEEIGLLPVLLGLSGARGEQQHEHRDESEHQNATATEVT